MPRGTNTDGTMVYVETDLKEVLDTLEEMGGRRSTMMRHLLSGIGTAAKGEVKRSYKSFGLSKGTGTLYKSIQRKVFRNGKAVAIQAKARRGDGVFYGYALAKGSIITARNGKWLTFKKDGKWVKVHSVKLPERDFVEAPVKAYLRSIEFQNKVDELMEKEIRKIEKANARKEAAR